MDPFSVRKETPEDHESVDSLVRVAFAGLEKSDGTEFELVQRLRQASTFVPELSLVAVQGSEVIGHILFTPIHIQGVKGNAPSLALAPICVLPRHQKKGVGSRLIQAGHAIARQKGYGSVVLLGHPDYYRGFGYIPASTFGIVAPFEVPDEAYMALELIPEGLKGVSGKVIYPPAFKIR